MTTAGKVCKRCRRVLEKRVRSGVVTWEHAKQDSLADHQPVPVDLDRVPTIKGRCDFCNDDNPSWVLPTRPITGLVGLDGKSRGYEADWAACDECAPLIDRNDWGGLLKRVQRRWEANHDMPAPEDKKTHWRRLYRLVRAHISGSVRPL